MAGRCDQGGHPQGWLGGHKAGFLAGCIAAATAASTGLRTIASGIRLGTIGAATIAAKVAGATRIVTMAAMTAGALEPSPSRSGRLADALAAGCASGRRRLRNCLASALR